MAGNRRSLDARGLLVAGSLVAGTWLLLSDIAADPASPPPLLALACLAVAAVLQLAPGSVAADPGRAWLSIAIPLLLAGVLTLYVLQRLPLMPHVADYSGIFLAWVLACVLYSLAFAGPLRGSRRRLASLWRVSRAESWLLAAIVIVAAVARLWQLGSIPYIFGGDEAGFSLWSLSTATGEIANPFALGWLSQPLLGMFYEGLALRLTGPTIEGARLPWALLGIAAVAVTFCLASRVRGTMVGLVTAGLLAVYHFHIHYSRNALNNIADTFFMGLALLFLLIGVERRSMLAWTLCGMAAGLAFYFYQGARLTPLVVAAAVAYLILRQGGAFRKRLLSGAGAAAGAFLVSAAPMLQTALRFPDDFNARINQISIFAPGWLDQEMARTGQAAYEILWDQFRRSVLAFNVYPDTSPHYNLPAPLLDPLFGALFLAGLVYATVAALVSRAGWRMLPVVLWWWGGVITGGALTLSPPTSQRLITLAVPVCFFIALAMDQLLRLLPRLRIDLPRRAVMAAAVLLFAAISLKTYFVDYTPRHLNGARSDAIAMELVPELKALGPRAKVYFAGAPEMFWGFASMSYLAPNARGEDILDPLSGPPAADLIAAGHEALFVFLPGRLEELEYVRRTFPGGTLKTLASPVDGQVIATLYKVSR